MLLGGGAGGGDGDPYLPWAKIKGTYYYWDAKTGPNIRGNILGVAIELTPSVSFEFGITTLRPSKRA
jgi:hypothetical protein